MVEISSAEWDEAFAECYRLLERWNQQPGAVLDFGHEQGFEYGFELGYRFAKGEVIE